MGPGRGDNRSAVGDHPQTRLVNSPSEQSAADLFALVWESLADIIGTAATATVFRQALRGLASDGAGSATGIVIERQDLDYRYRVPESWRHPADAESLQAFRVVAREVGALLAKLTGPVLVSHLERMAPFRERGILFGEKEQP